MPVLNPKGKNAIVTGGGSGINLAFVKKLYEAGCGVLIADLHLHATAEEWRRSIQDQPGPRVLFRKVDVSNWEELEGTFSFFAKEFGSAPDIVVPGAGVYEPSFNPFWDDVDAPSHYKLLDINLLHPIKMTRVAVRRMRQANKPGVILHLSSISAQMPSITVPLYAVSKAGISQFVRSMANLEDLARIRVVAIAPGTVSTPLFHDNPKTLALIDLEKDFALAPEEVAEAMMALVTDPKYPPGTVLEVGDIGTWREVKLLNDIGPQGRATKLRDRAKNAVNDVKEVLKKDAEGGS